MLNLLEHDIPKVKTAKYAEALIRLRLMNDERDESVLTFFGRALSAALDNTELRAFFLPNLSDQCLVAARSDHPDHDPGQPRRTAGWLR